MTNTETLNEMFAKARTAQEEFAEYDQVQVDAVVKAIARAVFDNAERLARMAVDETGMSPDAMPAPRIDVPTIVACFRMFSFFFLM
jgi:NAD-dependent aldehyde dehydrogenases